MQRGGSDATDHQEIETKPPAAKMQAESEGVRRAWESPPSGATASSSAGPYAARRMLKAQKSNRGGRSHSSFSRSPG